MVDSVGIYSLSAESEAFHRSPFLTKVTGPASPIIQDYGAINEEHKTISLLYQQQTLTQPIIKRERGLPMFNQLKALFPEIQLLTPHLDVDTNEYIWFKTEDNQVLGLPQDTTTNREIQLLSTFLQPYDIRHSTLSTREQLWQKWIYHTDNEDLTNVNEKFPHKYRYVFFSIRGKDVDLDAFQEAIQSLFPYKMPLLWESQDQGFIIEEHFDHFSEPIAYEDIIDVLMSDFYITLQLYITPYYYDKSDIQNGYNWGSKCFGMVPFNPSRPVLLYTDVMPYLYTNNLDYMDKEYIHSTILKPVIDEPDLLHTIRVFLACNSNATLASKELYMHRNSLQYRVDKFIEKTGIDVKQFQGALITYLALIQHHHDEM
ncbi:PucR family transcriptional regulator [Pontibacillus yanchengensis]|uniref:PucR C-terminal helix-turn-helix domain-containing protein n=1 Tax=Pontibacillus yanchengensis Y32 TaxID=1385514 RepID=A0A0A2T9M5_9BACI|nr:helix-turn-helix domain-containing protein [Pontibacillus yanchengensis]KGP72244.1 hypothetical protein N782_13370 [Pontibacillus yanchengensis Y32]